MSDSGDPKDSKEFLQVFRRGVQFSEELLAENERLRFRVAQLEQENKNLAQQALGCGTFKELLEKLRLADEDKKELLQCFESVEMENQDYAARYREMEEEVDRLANLYVASYQLHSTLDLEEVIRISFEILINLIGAERFALLIAGDDDLVPVRVQGMEMDQTVRVVPGKGRAGEAAARRELFLFEGELASASGPEPLACVPLQVAEDLLGVVVVYRFLPQKKELTDLDQELFKLLATHAGMALYASGLSVRSGRDGRDAVASLLASGG